MFKVFKIASLIPYFPYLSPEYPIANFIYIYIYILADENLVLWQIKRMQFIAFRYHQVSHYSEVTT